MTKVLYELSCQWSCDKDKMAGKRAALLDKLREVGEKRLRDGIKACVETHIGDFWPPQSVINTYIPQDLRNARNEANEREQAHLKRLYNEGSNDILYSAEALAFIKIVQKKVVDGEKIKFEDLWNQFIHNRTERRKAASR